MDKLEKKYSVIMGFHWDSRELKSLIFGNSFQERKDLVTINLGMIYKS